mmetsp:Transcript_18541/g.38040  ORF Transcript_18541/g.38040 Transcript_18541/m.38040 type:complete len:881 (+) Transcript_18541:225-2867(+)
MSNTSFITDDSSGSEIITDVFVEEERSSPGLLRDVTLVLMSAGITYIMVCLHRHHRHLQDKKREREQAEDISKASANESTNESAKISSTKEFQPDTRAAPMSKSCKMLMQQPGEQATGAFISAVLNQLWDHMNIAISNTIKQTLEPTLKDLPVPLHFTRLDLGNIPIKTENMLIHPVNLSNDVDNVAPTIKQSQAGVQINMDIIWDGNCDITLQATVSKSAKFSFGVHHLKVKGRLLILLSPLTTDLPVVTAVQYGFTNPPEVSLQFKGALLGALTKKFGYVQAALLNVIQSTLASMLVLPMRMVLPMDLGSYDYLDVYQPPVGMVRVRAIEGRGFTVLKKVFVNDVPDTYCILSLGASDGKRTSTQQDTCNPMWKDECFDFILYDHDQKIYVQVFDEDKSPLDPDDELGKAEISVRELLKSGGITELELLLEGKMTGCYVTLSAEMLYLSDQLQSLSSIQYEGKGNLCGLYTIVVTQAFNIPLPRVAAATYVKVQCGFCGNFEKTFYTSTVADYPGFDALNPMFDQVFYVPITAEMLKENLSTPTEVSGKSTADSDGHKCIVFTLIDAEGVDGSKGHGELGSITLTHEALVRAYKHTITETRPIGNQGAKIEFRVVLNGMQSEEEKTSWEEEQKKRKSLHVAGVNNLDPTLEDVDHKEHVRVTALRGRGFTVRKRGPLKKDDVPDVFLRISVICGEGNEEPHQMGWRTRTIKDDTMPQWSESRDFTIDTVRSLIRIDAHDENRKGKDDYLGSAEVPMAHALRKRMMELELLQGTSGTGFFITLKVVPLDEPKMSHEENESDDVVGPLAVKSAPPQFHLADVYGTIEIGTEVFDNDNVTIVSTTSTSTEKKSSSKLKRLGKKLTSKLSGIHHHDRNNHHS